MAGCIANRSSTDDGPNPPPSTGVTVTPDSATVAAGADQQFTASVAGGGDAGVTWQVNGVDGGDAGTGTITASGLYTAPPLPPAGGKVTITAVSKADSSKSGAATATISYSNASINGDYVFSYRGALTSGAIAAAGRFRADGNGTIGAGSEDVNAPSGVFLNLAFNGSYTVDADGRGTMTFSSNRDTAEFRFVLGPDGAIEIVQFADDAVAAGNIVKRDSTAFGTQSLSGDYVFTLSGDRRGGGHTEIVGGMNADGGGAASGIVDQNAGGAIATQVGFSGGYAIDDDGRGTLTLTTTAGSSHYVLYAASNGEFKLLRVDPDFPFNGNVTPQQSASFSAADLNGDFAFDLSGTQALGAFAAAGRFTADGRGGIGAGAIDRNASGAVLQNRALAGTYTVADNGRGTATLNLAGQHIGLVFYLISADRAVALETDGAAIAGGDFFAQRDGPFSTGDFDASYAWFTDTFSAVAARAEAGRLALDGDGNIDGAEAMNDNGALAPDSALSGSYTFADNGRGTLTLTSAGGATRQYVVYAVSPERAVAIPVDSAPAGVMTLTKRY